MIRKQAPAPVYSQQPRATAPAAWQAQPGPKTAAQPKFPVNAALAGGQTPQPTFRGQTPDAPAAATAPPLVLPPLVLPTPQQLGLAPAKAASAPAAEIDWNDVRVRLRRLGAVGFHLDHVSAGQWRARLLVPVAGQGPRTLEASAASDAAAVAGVLQQADLSVALR